MGWHIKDANRAVPAAGASRQPVHADLDAPGLPDQRRRRRHLLDRGSPRQRGYPFDPGATAPARASPARTRPVIGFKRFFTETRSYRAKGFKYHIVETDNGRRRRGRSGPLAAAREDQRQAAPRAQVARRPMSIRFHTLAAGGARARCSCCCPRPRARSPTATRRATISRPARSIRRSRTQPSQAVELQLIGLLDAAERGAATRSRSPWSPTRATSSTCPRCCGKPQQYAEYVVAQLEGVRVDGRRARARSSRPPASAWPAPAATRRPRWPGLAGAAGGTGDQLAVAAQAAVRQLAASERASAAGQRAARRRCRSSRPQRTRAPATTSAA